MRLALLLLITIFISGCGDNFCGDEVIKKESNTQQKVTLIYIEKNCGATTGFSHQIFLVPKDAAIDDFDPIFVADNVEELDVNWVSEKSLKIRFKEARIFRFTNFWHSKSVDNFNYIIDINLVKA